MLRFCLVDEQMKNFLKTKTPLPLDEHQMITCEEILFPDQREIYVSFMAMNFLAEKDTVLVETEQIHLSTGERESFQLRMTIDGIDDFAAEKN